MARGYYGKELRRLIVQMARRHHLDPHALLAVATVEGGFNGAVGDHGTSFGPFQLHVGGALPAGKDRRWANSHEGIAYAVSRIAGVASGQRGRQAVHSIVYRFERPAAPGAEVERAMGVYGTVHGGGGGRGGGFYVNPYSRAAKYGPDQGYDFGMNGPVGAVGKAKIIRSGKIHFKQGWGYIVSYRLLQGPMKGRAIYVMENIRPTVKVGQVVQKGQTIAVAKNHYPYLETGWATRSGSMLAPMGSTKLGRDFFSFLQNAPNYGGGGKIAPPPDRNNQGMPSPDNQTGQFSQGGLPGLPAPEDMGFAPPGGFESLPGQPGGVAELPGMGNSFVPPDASQNWRLLGDLPGSSPETLAFAQRARLYNQIGNR